jgi:hypothetical protein
MISMNYVYQQEEKKDNQYQLCKHTCLSLRNIDDINDLREKLSTQ